MLCEKTKYPRTPHLPYSQGRQQDDIVSNKKDIFKNKIIVVTEKMDGENTTLCRNHIYTRSLDYSYHWSRTRLQSFHSQISYLIPTGYRICGENLVATHSIKYENLDSFFLAFSVWKNNECLSWDESEKFLKNIGVSMVPVLWKGEWDEKKILSIIKSLDLKTQEGIVVRNASSFSLNNFESNIAKWVRPNHVTTDKHWKFASREENSWKNKKK